MAMIWPILKLNNDNVMCCIKKIDEQFRNSCILNNTDKGAVLKSLALIDHKVYKIVFNLVCRDTKYELFNLI